MTKKEFIDKYGLDLYCPDGDIDSRSVIWLAASNLSDAQALHRGSEYVNAKINDIKEFLFDWNRVLKGEELLNIN